ncbi:hypothetical protein OJ252_2923 [Cryptosporidium canis]|uniref:Uncharacterized protein n=1 Tax=Cryptosporidium canis TaxID=195482 RepID=A0ABQ8P463_9CRYT|nr:hypothetical protein OJ252_2923 [Cryptosporidium canis]
MGISDASENTLRIIKAANRSLLFHQDRLGRAGTTARQKAPLRRDSGSSRPIETHTLGPAPGHLKLEPKPEPEPEPEPLRDEECDPPESIQGAQDKIRELEDRISKILEYSSVLEETLKQNIDMSNSARSPHRCCSCSCNSNNNNNDSYYSGRDCSRELDKPRFTGMLRDLVLMASRKKARQAKAKAQAQAQASSGSRHGQAPGHTSQMPESLVEYLSSSILERCIDDILASIDTAIHEFSVKFVQQEHLEAETIQ